jgi:hypothetical protein
MGRPVTRDGARGERAPHPAQGLLNSASTHSGQKKRDLVVNVEERSPSLLGIGPLAPTIGADQVVVSRLFHARMVAGF